MALQLDNKTYPKEFEFIPTSEREEKAPFSIKFKRLQLDRLARIQDHAIDISQDGGYTINANAQNLTVLKETLIGWDNIEVGGKPLKFKIEHNKASIESLEYLPVDMRAEIATVILAVSQNPSEAESVLTA